MTIVQRGTWTGWPDGVVIELADDCASALLTAARDFQTETGVDLKGDYLVLPVGGKRTAAEVEETQWAFDYGTHGIRRPASTAAQRSQSAALYAKYNMDSASTARPSSTSPHLTGYCMDISNNRFLTWLKLNGARYGIKFTLIAAGDLRHAQYFPGTATASLNVTTIDNTEDDMYDAAAESRALAASTPYVLVATNGEITLPDGTKRNGWYWIDKRDGSELNCPSQGYATLVAAWGLSTATPSRVVADGNEWTYITKQWAPAIGDPAVTAVATPALSEAQVSELAEAIAAAIPAPDFSSLAAQITSLDTQDDTRHDQIVALLQKQFTGTITITPGA